LSDSNSINNDRLNIFCQQIGHLYKYKLNMTSYIRTKMKDDIFIKTKNLFYICQNK